MAERKQVMSYLTTGIIMVFAGLFLLFFNFIMSWINFAYLNWVVGGFLVVIGFGTMKSKKGLGWGLIIAGILVITGVLFGILKVAGIIGLVGGGIAIFMGIMKVKENS
jgi:hypothetical protein